MHTSFSDQPSYWTAAGHRLLGNLAGSIRLADVTRTTADAISAFVAPTLGRVPAPSMTHVLADHASLHANRLVAPTGV